MDSVYKQHKGGFQGSCSVAKVPKSATYMYYVHNDNQLAVTDVHGGSNNLAVQVHYFMWQDEQLHV